MSGPGKMPQLIDERLLGDMKPDPPLRHVRLQRLDAQQLVRAVDERPHRQGNPALRRPLHQHMGEKLLKLHGFHAPKQRMMHIVQGNHILNDAIGMPLADARLHHVERHTPAEEAADEDRGRVTPRALFAERMAEHKKSIDAEADRVRAAGGLYIIGTERHESRRIDNQLRGRSGRQGDPGESRFYIALTDDVMRLFGSERMQSMMETLRVDEDTPLDHKMLSNAIEQAQRTVESRNFQARKNVLEYDDVMNVQRNVIYEERRKVLDGEDLQEHVQHMIRTVITGDIAAGMAEHHPENDKDLHEILAPLEKLFPCDLSYTAEELHKLTPDTLSDAVYDCAMKAYAAREEAFGLQPDGTPLMRELERVVMLRVVDEYWMDHLEAMDDLRQGIGLRAYGNVKPVDEYKRAGFDMFDEMVNGIQSETVRRLFTVRVRREQKLERKTVARSAATNAGGDDSEKKRPVRRVKKPGRNDPCPCGKLRPNGLPMKYKDCCGKNA